MYNQELRIALDLKHAHIEPSVFECDGHHSAWQVPLKSILDRDQESLRALLVIRSVLVVAILSCFSYFLSPEVSVSKSFVPDLVLEIQEGRLEGGEAVIPLSPDKVKPVAVSQPNLMKLECKNCLAPLDLEVFDPLSNTVVLSFEFAG